MPRVRAFLALVLTAGFAASASAQFFRVPIVIRPPVRVVPIHAGAAMGHAGGGTADPVDKRTAISAIVVCVALGVVVLALAVRDIRRARQAQSAVVRVIAPPPGEAPDWVRAAWVGLEFPLAPGQTGPEPTNATQVLSGQAVFTPAGYALDSATALKVLEGASVDAANWWRENAAPAPGHQLIFPAEVCERMDAVG